MRKFKELNLGVFFGLLNEKAVYVKISDTTAKNVINCDYIDIDKEDWIVIYF